MTRWTAVPLCCACFVAGCIGDSSSVTTVYAPTLLTADPSSFIGSVHCGAELRKYVVTLFDVTTGTAQQIATSPPTSCTTPTTFGTPIISSPHSYIADIDGYDRDDIVPQGGIDSGSRVMVDPTTMATVPPKWTTTCGEIVELTDGEVPADVSVNPLRYPTLTLGNVEVILHGCLPLRPSELSSDAGSTDAQPDEPTDTTDGGEAPVPDAGGAGKAVP
jgi:hypothetical protein